MHDFDRIVTEMSVEFMKGMLANDQRPFNREPEFLSSLAIEYAEIHALQLQAWREKNEADI
jgi:hypothetical protein